MRLRFGVRGLAAALLLAGAPLLAQDNARGRPSPPPAPAGNDRPARACRISASTARSLARPNSQPAAAPPATRSRQPAARSDIRRPRPSPAPTRQRRQSDRAAAQPSQRRPAIDPTCQPADACAAAEPATAPPHRRPVLRRARRCRRRLPPRGGFSPLPWLAALLLLGAGGGASISGCSGGASAMPAPAGQRIRRGTLRQPDAAASRTARAPSPRRAPRPDPVPEPHGTVTSPLRPPSPPAGLVSTGLRPWIELELEPSQAMVTDEHAAIAFDVDLVQLGQRPGARRAGRGLPDQRRASSRTWRSAAFFATPGEVGDKIPAIAPLARVTLKSAVRLPRSAVQEYEVEGRKLFVPMVAFNSRYRWSSGEGQSVASFLVGRAANDGEKLAPFRLDHGARGWQGLGRPPLRKGHSRLARATLPNCSCARRAPRRRRGAAARLRPARATASRSACSSRPSSLPISICTARSPAGQTSRAPFGEQQIDFRRPAADALDLGQQRDRFLVVLGQVGEVELAGQHQPGEAARIAGLLPRQAGARAAPRRSPSSSCLRSGGCAEAGVRAWSTSTAPRRR